MDEQFDEAEDEDAAELDEDVERGETDVKSDAYRVVIFMCFDEGLLFVVENVFESGISSKSSILATSGMLLLDE